MARTRLGSALRHRLRWAVPAALLVGASAADAAPNAAAQAAPSAGAADPSREALERRFRETVRPFLDVHCASCHGKEKVKGGLDLRPFGSVEAVTKDFRRWEAIVDQVKTSEMPPEDAKPQPPAALREAVVAWFAALRADESRRHAGDPGPVLARRLSNAEYDYTIRDLTGVDIRPAKEFPVDPANEAGFDNSGESLKMSPALATKYLEAARKVADHLVLKPRGFAFAPHPVIADTDRDKYTVRRIVDFYQRQKTDPADYFLAAWRFKHRAALGRPRTTLATIAAASGLSPKYLATVWSILGGKREATGPVAALQAAFRALPGPEKRQEPATVRPACERLRDLVVGLRGQVKVEVGNLTIPGANRGAQALVLWKDRQMAANRRTCSDKIFDARADGEVPAVTAALEVPERPAARARHAAGWKRFCDVFPDAYYVSERGRVFLDPKEDALNVGRLLSAGFHNQMGYFRDDGPLYDLMLDAGQQRELDGLWQELDFVTGAPLRQHAGLIWFERSESGFLRGPEFDFARAEDKDNVSEEKFSRFAEVYTAKVRSVAKDPTAIKAVEEHFVRSRANIRWVERARLEAEPTHLEALAAFAQRAYRRPLAPQERQEIVAFYERLRKRDGLPHEEAVRDTLVGILMSPHFCYRVDLQAAGGAPRAGGAHASGADGDVQPLSDYALASRLSYFLWSSMPDEELLAAARGGTLRRPEVLLAQTRRMLKDDRVRGFVTEFSGHWLDFRRFEEHNAVDRGRFPTFTSELRQAMFEEPIRFVDDLVRRDGSALELLYGTHTFVNAALARHYGMPAPRADAAGGGDAWVRVDGADRYGRGGLLGMSVFLTKNAPGLRTSPVKRGYWVVRNLLGEQIPPPPPDVPELPSDEAKLGALTLREALARHREDRACSGCHARFDAIGLAFEGYGPVGERRDKDLGGRPVDTRAAFPGGGEGAGLDGLRAYLRGKRQAEFEENLGRKLLAYGLGRSLLLSDDATIADMRAKLSANGHKLSALVESVVLSPQFRNRRVPRALARN